MLQVSVARTQVPVAIVGIGNWRVRREGREVVAVTKARARKMDEK